MKTNEIFHGGVMSDTVTHKGTTVPRVKAGLYWFNGDLVWTSGGPHVSVGLDYLMIHHLVLESPIPGAMHETRSVSESAWRGRARAVLLRETMEPPT